MKLELSGDLLNELNKRKVFYEDSYEDIIWDLIEETMEISNETKRIIKQYEKNKLKFVSLKKVAKELFI